MRIKAKSPTGREVYIVQFLAHGSGVFAVTIDNQGYIESFPAYKLKVLESSFVKGE